MIAFTFHDLLEENRRTKPAGTAVVAGAEALTYDELGRRVEAAAGWLAARGVRRGDRVCVHLAKSIDEVVALFASARLGAVFVDVHAQWTPAQLGYVLADSAAKVLFTEAHKLRPLAQQGLPDSLRAIAVHGEAPDASALFPRRELGVAASLATAPGAAITRLPDVDAAAILYTSGSTGPPKGVVLSHRNVLDGARIVASYLHSRAEDRVMALMPFCFDYGLNQLTTTFLVGGTVVLQHVVMPAEIVKTLVRERVTGFAAVPATWVPFLEFLAEVPTSLPHLRYVTNTGGKIPDRFLARMDALLGDVDIYLMYGLTEAFRSTYLPPEHFAAKRGSIGRAIPNVETFVVDPGRGVCGPGETGELIHRGSLICQGYWGKPGLTAEVIKPCPELAHLIGDERVVHSGDLVRIDEDGFYWFVGRRDGLIKSSGFRISPTEIEEIVCDSGIVSTAVAFGVPDDALGQAVEVVVHAAARPDVDALMAHCRREMPHYMLPRRIHVWEAELPRTANDKLDRLAMIRALPA